MTLDVTIGKVILSRCGDLYEIPYIDVESCPLADHDICSKDFTLWQRESYRSGSTDFRDFFHKCVGDFYEEYHGERGTDDADTVYLLPVIEQIRALKVNKLWKPADTDRMNWLKYWCERAVELYGAEAGIRFS